MKEIDLLNKHMRAVNTVVLDGNKRYHVVTNGKITYTGNNVLKYWYRKFRGRKGSFRTTFKFK